MLAGVGHQEAEKIGLENVLQRRRHYQRLRLNKRVGMLSNIDSDVPSTFYTGFLQICPVGKRKLISWHSKRCNVWLE